MGDTIAKLGPGGKEKVRVYVRHVLFRHRDWRISGHGEENPYLQTVGVSTRAFVLTHCCLLFTFEKTPRGGSGSKPEGLALN